jgi:hypothetical protein
VNIPKKFTLGAVEWTVKIVEELGDENGNCNPETCIIHLKKTDNKDVLCITFCHELIHAFLFSTGRNENHDEVLVDGVAHYLYQYLRQLDG